MPVSYLVQAEHQQAEQQGAHGQRDAQRLEGMQFGVGVELGDVLLVHNE